MKYIMSLDQGTTGTTLSLVNQVGRLVAQVDQDFPQIYPRPGWVEHNAETIWQTVVDLVPKLLRKAQIKSTQIGAIGITNQRETVVAWDQKTLRTLAPAIVWQCRRTTDFCEELKKRNFEDQVKRLTGLRLDPYFSGTKMRWLLDQNRAVQRAARNHRLCFGTIDSFLISRLTDGQVHATDVSNASRTLLMDLKTLKWSPLMSKKLGVSLDFLPEIRPSIGSFGVTKGLSFLPNGIPISGVAGDQQAALFGQACFSEGEAKCTFGTGSFLLINSGHKPRFSKFGLLTTVAWQKQNEKPVYALEGGAFICGAAVQFLRDQLSLIKSSSEIEALANSVKDTAGVEFVPALTGLGAPHWAPEARGMILGLTRGTTRSHLARATLEAMALQNVDIFEAMSADLKKPIKSIRVDGGASANNLLMQMQADFAQAQVIRPKSVESTSLGAAFLAGLGCGYFKNEKHILQLWQKDRLFKPRLKKTETRQRLTKWKRAVRICLD